MRALEMVKDTGQSITSFRSGHTKERPFKIIKIGLEKPREQLYQHINERVNNMMKMGLLKEAEGLVDYRGRNNGDAG